MGNYSKAIGSFIGGLVGILAGFGIPVDWITPELQVAISTVLGSILGTYFAPKNIA